MLARPAPAIAHPRRARRRAADRRPIPAVRHIVMPFAVTATVVPEPYERIGAFLRRTGWATREDRQWRFRLPTVCVVNGAPVPRKQWKRRRIRPTDRVEFWSRPWGGQGGSTGKTVLSIAALVAVVALAAVAGPFAAGAIGLTAGTTAFAVTSALVTAGITAGGSLLIASLTRPNPGGQNAQDATKDQVEQLYSVAAQGNTARLLQPLTVQYGRFRSFPDFAISPWSEFSGNDQYLNVLLSIGLGNYEHEVLYIDDTVLWTLAGGVNGAFAGVTVETYEPNADVTLFPLNVTTSVEVSGQDITVATVGGFVANGAGSLATDIAVDVVFPQGLFAANITTGIVSTYSASLIVEVRTVDNSGIPTSGWSTAATQPWTLATKNPQRQTVKFAVTPGRYEVRVHRGEPTQNGDTITVGPNQYLAQNAMAWVGLRAFLQGPSSFPVTTVAIRIKANSQLTGTSARKFAWLGMRKLPVWNGSTMVLQATRNPFWAAYDAATNTEYGAARPPSKIDFQTVVDLADDADDREDTFDYRFTGAVSVPEALDTILKVTRSRHRWSGDVLTFVRDEWAAVPRMLLTDREIARGSFSVEYALNPDDAADAVILEYVDEEIWNGAEVQYPKNDDDFTSVTPARIRLPGVVNREHAHREAAFYYFQSQLRRVFVTLDTEHDGRMLGFGSRVRVQSELPLSWGYTGAITGRSSNILTVSPAPTWDVGAHYISIRTKIGRQFGPVLCTQGVDTAHIVLDGTDLAAVEAAQFMTLSDALARADGADDPSFDFGIASKRARDCIVVSGRPSQDRVTLALVVDNEDVHDTDLPDTPLRPDLPTLIDARTPIVGNLYASFRQGVAEPILDASWTPAPGAQYYVARVSYDGGTSWTQLPETIASNLSAVVERAGVRLQVAGVGVRHGPFVQVDVAAPTIQIKNYDLEPIAPAILAAQVREFSKRLNDRITAVEELTGNVVGLLGAATYENKTKLQANVAGNHTGLASIEHSFEVFAGDGGVYATDHEEIIAQLDDHTASITTNATALALVDGRLAAFYGITVDADGHAAAFELASDGTVAAIKFKADAFEIALNGYPDVTPFIIGAVNGTPTIGMRGNVVLDGETYITKTLHVADLVLGTRHLGAETVTSAPALAVLGSFVIVTWTSPADILTCTVSFQGYAGDNVTIDVSGKIMVQEPLGGSAVWGWRLTNGGATVYDQDAGVVTGGGHEHSTISTTFTVVATGSPQTVTVHLDTSWGSTGGGGVASWVASSANLRVLAYVR